MRVLFMGTPEFAIPSLAILLESHHEIVGIVTAPDRPKGRGLVISPPPVKRFALQRNLPVFQPEDLKNPKFLETVRQLRPDIIVVVAFRILPKVLYELPPYGTVNLHASLLPKYRGAAPINWAIINGEKETGVTTIFITENIDAGDIILQRKVEIGEEETAGQLHDRLATIGAEVLLETLDLIKRGEAPRQRQVGESTRAPKIRREDCEIDWSKDSIAIANLIRGLSPHPGAFTKYRGKTLKVFRSQIPGIRKSTRIPPGVVVKSRRKDEIVVKTGDGTISLLEVQLEGRRRMTAEEFLRGHFLRAGELLG